MIAVSVAFAKPTGFTHASALLARTLVIPALRLRNTILHGFCDDHTAGPRMAAVYLLVRLAFRLTLPSSAIRSAGAGVDASFNMSVQTALILLATCLGGAWGLVSAGSARRGTVFKVNTSCAADEGPVA